MKVLAFLPLAYLAGMEGFLVFLSYAIVVLTALLLISCIATIKRRKSIAVPVIPAARSEID
jgi:hypothetical protein